MNLYSLRHGEYVDLNGDVPMMRPQLSDSEYPLTETGIKTLKDEAKVLARWDIPIEIVLSSPFVRAYQTASIIAEALNLSVTQDARLTRTQFDVSYLEGIVHSYGLAKHILLVGHEPDFTNVIAAITGGTVQLERGWLAKITIQKLAPLKGELQWLLTPQVLCAL